MENSVDFPRLKRNLADHRREIKKHIVKIRSEERGRVFYET